MLNQRQRALGWAAAALVGIWALAWAGHWYFSNLKVTPEKVRAYVESVELNKLSAAARAEALRKLAAQLNALSLEERQQLRAEQTAYRWFEAMTEAEKGEFIEATMPTGFKQMLGAFEELPEEKRRRAVDDALKRLRETNERVQAGQIAMGQAGTNRPPPISAELQAKVRTIGLKTFYSQSSAQTKAELAPVLEELQRTMESGRMMRVR